MMLFDKQYENVHRGKIKVPNSLAQLGTFILSITIHWLFHEKYITFQC